MSDFVLRRWDLEPYPGDQAPPHIHDASDEAFFVVEGQLEVLVGKRRRLLRQGEHVLIDAGTVHTFATVGDAGARVLAIMTPEVDALIGALHSAATDEGRSGAWARYRSRVV